MAQQNELIESAAVCAALNIDRSTLTRWVEKGRIVPAMKLSGLRGAYLFDPAEVDRVRTANSATAP